jgi:hypothetical protein
MRMRRVDKFFKQDEILRIRSHARANKNTIELLLVEAISNDCLRSFATINKAHLHLVAQRPVQMQIVPRDCWERILRSQGMKDPVPRMQMLDGFNEGWIEFESGEARKKRNTSLESGIKSAIESSF